MDHHDFNSSRSVHSFSVCETEGMRTKMGKHELLDEHFVVIDGWNEKYEVSNYGRVVNTWSGKDVAVESDRYGDRYVRLRLGRRISVYRLRNLVAQGFFADWKPGVKVYYLKPDKNDCSIRNLTLIAQKDIREKNIEIVETGEQFATAHQVALRIGGNAGTVLKCLMGMGKTHKGYTFRYVLETET